MRACKRLYTRECVTARSCAGVCVRACVRVDMLLVKDPCSFAFTPTFMGHYHFAFMTVSCCFF